MATQALSRSQIEKIFSEKLGIPEEEVLEHLGLPEPSTALQARIASTLRHNPNADVSELRRRLEIKRIEERIQKTVSGAPKLSERQWNRLSAIIEAARESQHGSNEEERKAS